ncbi:SseB family protein, partial [Gemmiger formicilis]
MMLRFDDFANMLQKNQEASGLVLNPGENSLRLESALI